MDCEKEQRRSHRDIDAILADPDMITRALARGVREALVCHKKLSVSRSLPGVTAGWSVFHLRRSIRVLSIDECVTPEHCVADRIRGTPAPVVADLLQRITFDPNKCAGRPCIRGMRIRVSDILDLLAAGLSTEQVLKELPDLERDDIQAALLYASHRLDHPVLIA
jgi:uncharacterized protein (DUF433 family)